MSELRKLLEEEKEIRIKYQNIVYKLCNIVDRRAGGKCTIDSVLATLTELLDSKPVRVADGKCVDCKECASPCPMPSDVEVKIESVHSGSKYLRRVTSPLNNEQCLVDVYSVLDAYRVESQPVGHAVKKLLMAGQRGGKDRATDLQEAIDALQRAVQMEGGAET